MTRELERFEALWQLGYHKDGSLRRTAGAMTSRHGYVLTQPGFNGRLKHMDDKKSQDEAQKQQKKIERDAKAKKKSAELLQKAQDLETHIAQKLGEGKAVPKGEWRAWLKGAKEKARLCENGDLCSRIGQCEAKTRVEFDEMVKEVWSESQTIAQTAISPISEDVGVDN